MRQPLWFCHNCDERIQSARDRDGRVYISASAAAKGRWQRWTVVHWACDPNSASKLKTIEFYISNLETPEAVWTLYKKLHRMSFADISLARSTNLQETFHKALRINERNQ